MELNLKFLVGDVSIWNCKSKYCKFYDLLKNKMHEISDKDALEDEGYLNGQSVMTLLLANSESLRVSMVEQTITGSGPSHLCSSSLGPFGNRAEYPFISSMQTGWRNGERGFRSQDKRRCALPRATHPSWTDKSRVLAKLSLLLRFQRFNLFLRSPITKGKYFSLYGNVRKMIDAFNLTPARWWKLRRVRNLFTFIVQCCGSF